ncbi:MAG: fumarate hydratase [Ruminiclostridium sp.]|nr:fumarate hydratase [Ruminiclostridium sp.]
MREIDVKVITEKISELCIKANIYLPEGMKEKISSCIGCEKSQLCREVLSDIVRNIDCAKDMEVPICQDTGMAVIFIDIGQEVHFVGGSLEKAINEGVAKGYVEGKLRLSVVEDPLMRKNTDNNTPAIIHTRIVDGDKVHIMVAPKGFGSENMSAVKMFTPSASADDIIDFVVGTVSKAGSNPCPPITVGVGIGGDFEYAAILAKKALCRDLSRRNENPFYADMEQKMLDKINKLGIGSQGFGGTVTALYVNIEQYPTHIAGLPVAVNIGCHVTRHAEAEV